MSYPDPHPNPHVVEWADWLPYGIDEVPDDLLDLWAAAWEHDGIVDALWYGEWPCCRELPPGPTRPPSWLGHRDACPTQWHEPCDCDLPPRTTPCTCRYAVARSAYSHIQNWEGSVLSMEGLEVISWFTINSRCHHHGDRARTPQPAHNDTHNPYDLDTDERT